MAELCACIYFTPIFNVSMLRGRNSPAELFLTTSPGRKGQFRNCPRAQTARTAVQYEISAVARANSRWVGATTPVVASAGGRQTELCRLSVTTEAALSRRQGHKCAFSPRCARQKAAAEFLVTVHTSFSQSCFCHCPSCSLSVRMSGIVLANFWSKSLWIQLSAWNGSESFQKSNCAGRGEDPTGESSREQTSLTDDNCIHRQN